MLRGDPWRRKGEDEEGEEGEEDEEELAYERLEHVHFRLKAAQERIQQLYMQQHGGIHGHGGGGAYAGTGMAAVRGRRWEGVEGRKGPRTPPPPEVDGGEPGPWVDKEKRDVIRSKVRVHDLHDVCTQYIVTF